MDLLQYLMLTAVALAGVGSVAVLVSAWLERRASGS